MTSIDQPSRPTLWTHVKPLADKLLKHMAWQNVTGSALKKLCAVGVLSVPALVGCSHLAEPQGALRSESVHVLTQQGQLLTVNTGQPAKVLSRIALKGLPASEKLIGIDYRVARGTLYALAAGGTLYTVNPENGQVTQVGTTVSGAKLEGSRFGFDFNPAADRIRVVSDTGQSLRLHPDTGLLVAVDAPLTYDAADVHFGQAPAIEAAGYTYNKKDDKLTTNFAIDARLGNLVRQGSPEGVLPAISPNTGKLFTVGTLGIGPVTDASFDIADVSGAAFLAAQRTGADTPAGERLRLYLVNLVSGAAQLLGTLAEGQGIVGIAVIP